MNKRGDSNKACSWDFFLKKNKKNSMLIRDFRVWTIAEYHVKLYADMKKVYDDLIIINLYF